MRERARRLSSPQGAQLAPSLQLGWTIKQALASSRRSARDVVCRVGRSRGEGELPVDARTPTQLALDLLKSARRAFSPRSTCRVAMRRARGSRNVCKRPHTSRREQKSKRSACEPARGRATLLRRRLCSTWYRPGHGHQEGVRADEASPEAERRHARRSEEAG